MTGGSTKSPKCFSKRDKIDEFCASFLHATLDTEKLEQVLFLEASVILPDADARSFQKIVFFRIAARKNEFLQCKKSLLECGFRSFFPEPE